MRILVGISGAISVLDVHSYLLRLKAEPAVESLSVVMTPTAARFLEPRVLEAYLHQPVRVDPWTDPAGISPPPQIVDSRDIYLIIPASATTLARCASGSGETLVASCYLSFRGPVIFAPSMATPMLQHPAVIRNLELLEEDGAVILPCGPGISATTGEPAGGGLCSYRELWTCLQSLVPRAALS